MPETGSGAANSLPLIINFMHIFMQTPGSLTRWN